MLSMYTSYICIYCKKEFVLLTEELQNTKGYLVCPYCSSRKVKKEKVSDILKECMSERSYKRIKGVLRQVR
ncbi:MULTISPECIES: hypothetical protein [Clostridium]|uniref:Putative phage endopeptidase n=1 Tax=Clostridium sporogenes TaxID=1509 RepID=A0A1L3NDC3_CLOSG|nr:MULTISPECIES: hypothetical protein [Clostridium]APH14124.1 putative phage endopeptidase [Clostridium sporogenes]KOR52845.1 hypothetical protein ADT23_07385 [Clostridium botulinum]MBY6897994.1 hypothetical protein [Clostridium botulinum]MBY6908902.1 hypothetical protein [Clostridium botulinum]MBY6912307.1 hypothetical protein [Clostridium botulinum]